MKGGEIEFYLESERISRKKYDTVTRNLLEYIDGTPDVIAISVLSGAHMTYFKEIKKLMNQKGIDNVLLTGGGIIPSKDMEDLTAAGVGKLFGPGADVAESVEYIESWCKENRDGF